VDLEHFRGIFSRYKRTTILGLFWSAGISGRDDQVEPMVEQNVNLPLVDDVQLACSRFLC
jgi:hypothetical protein